MTQDLTQKHFTDTKRRHYLW